MVYAFLDPDAWMLHAACLGRTDLFFSPDDSESRAQRRYRESQAKTVCNACIAQDECLREAMTSDERFGIWGGLTERERRAARRSFALDLSDQIPAQDITGSGRLAPLPAAVVRGRSMSSPADGA